MIREIKREIKKQLQSNKSKNPIKIIELFKAKILSKLEEDINGIYLIGSFGLNDFNPNLSDIDFVVTLEKQLSKEQIEAINKIHLDIEKEALQPNLGGIYILEKDIGKPKEVIDRMTYFHEGVLKTVTDKASFFEINPITWAELHLHGYTVYGKKSNQLDIKLNWDEVIDYLYQNINSYWLKWLRESKNPLHAYFYMTLLRKSENAWCVAGVARQLYTLKEHQITSKKKACEYFKDKVPAEYKNILEDTIKFRNGDKPRASWKQKKDTLKFLEYCINNFNEEYRRKYGN